MDEAARGDLSLRETLALLCRAEVSHREERRIQVGTGIAQFPHQRTLDGFDFAAQPSLDAKQVRDLAACRWVANGDALLIQGAPGAVTSILTLQLSNALLGVGTSVDDRYLPRRRIMGCGPIQIRTFDNEIVVPFSVGDLTDRAKHLSAAYPLIEHLLLDLTLTSVQPCFQDATHRLWSRRLRAGVLLYPSV